VVAELKEGPGNITVTPQGRVIVSLHQFYDTPVRVAEVRPDGRLVPFPNAEWNRGTTETAGLDSVLGIQCDRDGVVWMLDNGMRLGSVPKLVGWDAKANRLHRIIYLPPPLTAKDSFVNDLAVDAARNIAYVADPAGGANAALILVDLKTGSAQRVLQGHRSVVPEADAELAIEGRPVRMQLPDGTVASPRIGVNPIALDATNGWLYYGPMHGRSLYRVRTEDLRNQQLTSGQLAARVQRYSDKPICDGISIDRAGNIYLGDLPANTLGVIGKDRKYRRLPSDPRISWADAFSFSTDGRLYFVSNQLHKTARLNGGTMEAKAPFYVLALKPLAKGIVGR
jgi:sugar lactone lactonase YvrE